MPALRLDQTLEEAFRICFERRWQPEGRALLHRHAAFVRALWHRAAALPLILANNLPGADFL